jgi:hypothetical protein
MKYLLAWITCSTLLAESALHLTDGPAVQAALDRINEDSPSSGAPASKLRLTADIFRTPIFFS